MPMTEETVPDGFTVLDDRFWSESQSWDIEQLYAYREKRFRVLIRRPSAVAYSSASIEQFNLEQGCWHPVAAIAHPLMKSVEVDPSSDAALLEAKARQAAGEDIRWLLTYITKLYGGPQSGARGFEREG